MESLFEILKVTQQMEACMPSVQQKKHQQKSVQVPFTPMNVFDALLLIVLPLLINFLYVHNDNN